MGTGHPPVEEDLPADRVEEDLLSVIVLRDGDPAVPLIPVLHIPGTVTISMPIIAIIRIPTGHTHGDRAGIRWAFS